MTNSRQHSICSAKEVHRIKIVLVGQGSQCHLYKERLPSRAGDSRVRHNIDISISLLRRKRKVIPQCVIFGNEHYGYNTFGFICRQN